MTATGMRCLAIALRSLSLPRNRSVESWSNVPGWTGMTIASARRTSFSACFTFIAAGESITRRSVPSGGSPISFTQSIAAIAGSAFGRRATQPRLERWRSTWARLVPFPVLAKAAARLVATVVLPQPPFTLATRTENIQPRLSRWSLNPSTLRQDIDERPHRQCLRPCRPPARRNREFLDRCPCAVLRAGRKSIVAEIRQRRSAARRRHVSGRAGRGRDQQQLPRLPLGRHGAQSAGTANGGVAGRGPQDAPRLQSAERPPGPRRNPRNSGQRQGREIGRTQNHPGV